MTPRSPRRKFAPLLLTGQPSRYPIVEILAESSHGPDSDGSVGSKERGRHRPVTESHGQRAVNPLATSRYERLPYVQIDEVAKLVVEPEILRNRSVIVVRVHIDVDIEFQSWVVDKAREGKSTPFDFKIVSTESP